MQFGKTIKSEDIDKNEVVDETCDDEQFTRLNEVVRKHYVSYLQKQLLENVRAWTSRLESKSENVVSAELHIDKCVQILEDKALKACMMAQLYQRAMIKIIATVRRDTQECRLADNLHSLLNSESQITTANHIQNDSTSMSKSFVDKYVQTDSTDDSTFCSSLTLQQKIDMFQERLNAETTTKTTTTGETSDGSLKLSTAKMKPKKRKNHLNIERVENQLSHSKLNSPKHSKKHVEDSADEPDTIALELALLFNEERTELDEIFGIDPNDEPDDPQISSILKEIENSKIQHGKLQDVATATTSSALRAATNQTTEPIDLSKSLWPCELYMQRRRLAEILMRLVEEDIRWTEIFKYEFVELFGEDSDDEFGTYSPSIDLDDVLMGSCIRRISPWIVHYLMKPLNEGLIANRFLFKKLAKKLAQSIITDIQYPSEVMVKSAIENFFCLQRSVLSDDDLEKIPTISLTEV